jgi:pimeloyl-ACP methyl ester carboxylesterase
MRLLALVPALAVAAFSAQSTLAQAIVPDAIYTAPQDLVAIDGVRRLNLYCDGSGSPTVVLDAGAGNSIATWRHVQAEIAKVTRVCAYDRAGLGFSDAAERPSDLKNMVDDLHRLVKAAGLSTPIVYVGHSLAGSVGQLYAAAYPGDIAGAMLVEPAFAGDLAAMQAELPPDKNNAVAEAFERTLDVKRACLSLARKGELTNPGTREALDCLDIGWDPDASSDDVLRRTMVHLQTLPRVWEAQISELDCFVPRSGRPDVDSAELSDVKLDFDHKPLAVLTRGVEEGGPGVPPAYVPKVEASWRAGHDRIAALSSWGQNIIVPGARHYVQIDRPQAVIDAVRRVVEAVRAQ